MRVAAEISICVDCLAYLANGEGEELEPGKLEAIQAGIEREGGHVVVACPEDCEGWFSWSACELCGETLGGERHPGAVLVPESTL